MRGTYREEGVAESARMQPTLRTLTRYVVPPPPVLRLVLVIRISALSVRLRPRTPKVRTVGWYRLCYGTR